MSKSKSLLIIEDDPDLRMTLEYFLGKIGYQVLTAKTCEEGIEMLANTHPRAILCDIMLPGMDGYEACEKIKGDPATQDIQIIFISARDGSEIQRKGAEVGADYYISKPVDPNDVGADLYYLFEQDFHLAPGDAKKLRSARKIEPQDGGTSSGPAPAVESVGHTSHAVAHEAHSGEDEEFNFDMGGAPPQPQPVGTLPPSTHEQGGSDFSAESLSDMNLSEVHELLRSLRDSLKDTGQRLDAILQYIEVIEE